MKRRRRESGQAVLEYIILVSITLGIVIAFARAITGTFDKSAPKMGGNLERQLRAGAAPAKVWRQ